MTREELIEQLHARLACGDELALIVTAREIDQWPQGALDDLVRDGLLQPTQPAATADCTACFDDHAEVVQVVEEPPGSEARYYIACPTMGRVAVDPDRMKRWEIQPPAFESRMASSTGHASAAIGERPSANETSPDNRVAMWPQTAAAFHGILRQAKRAGALTLRWAQIRERLAAQGHHPSRARDVRRHVPDWDEVIESPKRGVYRLKG